METLTRRLHEESAHLAHTEENIHSGRKRGEEWTGPRVRGRRGRVISYSKLLTATYDHRLRRIGHPVRSAIHKPQIGRLVVGWVTTSESLLLYVLRRAFAFAGVRFCSPPTFPSLPTRDNLWCTRDSLPWTRPAQHRKKHWSTAPPTGSRVLLPPLGQSTMPHRTRPSAIAGGRETDRVGRGAWPVTFGGRENARTG